MKKALSWLAAFALAALVVPVSAQDSADSMEAGAMTTKPRVVIETTLGSITLELDGEKAPITVANFIRYANEDFYDGTVFHRVMPDFMIQGGGYTAEIDEKPKTNPSIKNEWKNGLKNVRGSIAMARLGNQPDSATAQFFINVVDNAALDMPRDGAGYAVFGAVTEGMDVVDAIKNTETVTHPKYQGGKVVPKVAVVINDVKVLDKFDNEKAKTIAEANMPKEKTADTVQAELEAEHGKKFTTTASGLRYMHVTEGTGTKPTAAQTVKVHYRGTLLDGTEFDSSYKRNQPIEFPLNGVIAGWTEGVQLMGVGGKTLFIIPSNLAYGARGAGGVIGPNATLVFEVELLDVR